MYTVRVTPIGLSVTIALFGKENKQSSFFPALLPAMLAFLVGMLLATTPADSTDSLDACLRQAPVQSPPPIVWGEGIQRTWYSDSPVPLDTVRASLSQVREARGCFLSLDPSRVERPYLGNVMRTFYVEAALLAALRRFPEAFDTFEKAHSYIESDPPIPSTETGRTGWPRSLYQNEGLLHYMLGDLSSAINHYLKALQKTPEKKAYLRVRHLIDVAVLHQHMQDYRSARHYFDRGTRLFEKSELPSTTGSQQRSRLLHAKADFLLEKTLNTGFNPDLLERAEDLARQGRAVAEPGSERRATVTLVLSEALGCLGHPERAYQLNAEARQYARANDATRLHAFALLKLGMLHMQTDRWAPAESVLSRALTMAEALDDLDYQRRIHRALGRLHELQTEWAEAEAFYRQGVAVIEKYRESLTATQWSSTAFARWRDVHRGLVRTLLAQDRPRDGLAVLDRTRGRHLQDLRTQARVANQLSATARVRLDSVSRALSDVRTRLGKDTLSNADEVDLRNREATLMTARQEILGRGSTTIDRPSIEQIAASLDQQDRALVSYFLDDPWPVYDRAPRSAAFILTADTLRAVSLPELTQDSVRAQVTDISPLFAQTGAPNGFNAMHFDLRPLRTLHDRLYAPVGEYLPDGKPLTVIPDGPMFHLPYSMLATATPGGRYDHTQARFVLHDRPTALELATSMVVDTSSPSDFDLDLAAFGVSTFDTRQTVPSALRATLPEAASDFAPLPGVRTEMKTLKRLFGDAETFLDEASTESAFASACRRAGVLHLASHAFVHPSSPLQNAFLLRPDSTSDGVLFLHELQAQDREIPLAVLSGCSTAQGTLRGGEGMAGLQYGFRAMGAQSTVSNLWPTADRPSVTLMEAFYENLRAGLPKDRALRQAKLTYLESHPNEASPFFWAPSVLYGSPQPVPLSGRDSVSLWAWGAAVLILTTLLLALFLWWGSRSPDSSGRFFSS
jgi:CHAT domain-containing protein